MVRRAGGLAGLGGAGLRGAGLGGAKRRLVATGLTLVCLVAGLMALTGDAKGAVPFEDATFGGYASATGIHVDALQAAAPGPRVADLEVGYTAAAVDSEALDSATQNEMQLVAQPAHPDKNSYGRGSAVEVGLVEGLPLPPEDQAAILAGLVEATAPPTSDPPPRQIEVEGLDPVVYATAATGDAAAAYDPLRCVTDRPLGFGRAHVAKAQLLNAGPQNSDGSMRGPVVAVDSPPDTDPNAPARNAVDSRSLTYLFPNPDGTYGVVSETRMTMAPVSLLTDPLTNRSAVTIEVLGEWVLRVHASGLGPATIQYGPDPATPLETKVIRVLTDGVEAGSLTFQQLLDGEGLVVPALPLLRIAIGEDPRAIAAPGTAPDSDSLPTRTVTEGAAAVDVVSVQLLGFAPPAEPAHLADIRLGHMEARALVPQGGIDCTDETATTSTTATTAPTTTTSTTAPVCPPFTGSATGTVLHADLLQAAADGPRLADAEIGFTGASVDSQGLDSPRQNENQVVFQPVRPTKRSYGLGSALELGVATNPPLTEDQMQLKLAGRATAEAPPPESDFPDQIGTGDVLDPLLFANLLKGEAAAAFDASDNITSGDMAFGRAYVANLDLINGGSTVGPDGFSGPLVELGGPTGEVSTSTSRTFLEPLGGGRFAFVSETRQTIAPITIGMGTDTTTDDITVELLGEWVLRLRVTGQGQATLQYGPTGSTDESTPVLRVFQGGAEVEGLTLQELLGQQGLVVNAGPLALVAVGEDPRAIAPPGTTPNADSEPTLTTTSGAAAVDVLALQLLIPQPGNGPRLVDLRLGHMEVRGNVPLGGIVACDEPPPPTTTTTAPSTTTTGPTTTSTTTAPTTTSTTAAPTTTTTDPPTTTSTTAAPTTTTAAPTTTTAAPTTSTTAPSSTTSTSRATSTTAPPSITSTTARPATTSTSDPPVVGQVSTTSTSIASGVRGTAVVRTGARWITPLILVGLLLAGLGIAVVRMSDRRHGRA